ncbi:MAG: hypothetical protein N2749_06685 [Clostridia bacterium]|nr:hypothetical protein [Clostridia bacterium]
MLVKDSNNKTVLILNYIENVITSTLKAIVYIVLFVFASVGITAIINPSIRGFILSIF